MMLWFFQSYWTSGRRASVGPADAKDTGGDKTHGRQFTLGKNRSCLTVCGGGKGRLRGCSSLSDKGYDGGRGFASAMEEGGASTADRRFFTVPAADIWMCLEGRGL